jgi:hypothetical protein
MLEPGIFLRPQAPPRAADKVAGDDPDDQLAAHAG